MEQAEEIKNKDIDHETSGSTVITMEQVSKSFGTQEVLRDISLEVKRGENLVILGRSGSGKSVLIKCLVRLLEPDSGKISILGKDILALRAKELNELRKNIGFMFQGGALYDSMSVGENLEFPLREAKRLRKNERRERVSEALENVGLGDAIDKMPSELSGGMCKRIGLARALMLKPKLLFYDEPTAGLDTITAREINKLILQMQGKYSASSVLITHDIECARMTANRMLVIRDGRCEAEGTFEELEHSENKWVRSFFG
jgi:phospholipid/cholesterol/gamma-HCH transport system ATP-binding protein